MAEALTLAVTEALAVAVAEALAVDVAEALALCVGVAEMLAVPDSLAVPVSVRGVLVGLWLKLSVNETLSVAEALAVDVAETELLAVDVAEALIEAVNVGVHAAQSGGHGWEIVTSSSSVTGLFPPPLQPSVSVGRSSGGQLCTVWRPLESTYHIMYCFAVGCHPILYFSPPSQSLTQKFPSNV